MDFRKPELILVIFVTFIVASYVELNFGGFGSSGYLAFIFFIISLVLLSRLLAGLKGDRQTRLKSSKNPPSLVKVTVILIIASYLANLLRVLSLVSIGYYYGLDTMLIFHTFLGWALFVAIVLPMAYVYLK